MVARLAFLLVVAACASAPAHVRSTYGSRAGVHGEERRGRHAGVDFEAPEGSPVLAAADGVVAATMVDEPGCGNGVLLRHRPDVFTLVCHMKEVEVAPCRQVQRGDHLGTVGAAGGVAHVHFELCNHFCPRGHPDGDLRGTADPLAYSAGCYRRGRSVGRLGQARRWLTYPIACDRSQEPERPSAPGVGAETPCAKPIRPPAIGER